MRIFRKIMIHDSAVSEAVGFIIIFGIMLTGIGLVTVYGYPVLVQEQQNSNIRNMERNMIMLQSDFNSLYMKSVPYKETMMQVNGGVLTIRPPDRDASFFNISDSAGFLLDPAIFQNGEFLPGELSFLSDSGDISVSLENGAVVYYQTGGSVMLSKPRWFIDTSPISGDSTLVIILIQVSGSGSSSAISGITTIQMVIEPLIINDPDGILGNDDDSNVIDRTYTDEDIQIKITLAEKYYTAWKNYFENELQMSKVDATTWRKDNVDRVIIKAWKINIINL